MFQKELDRITEQIEADGIRPSLLLHVCCAPCSSYVLEYLHRYFDITAYYYNPNILPESEFVKRLAELNRLVSELPAASGIPVVSAEYDHAEFLDAVRGLEDEPEGGERCTVCFRQRLEASARYASERHFDYYTTTLSISPHKDAKRLNSIGQELAKKYGVRFLPSDFKKRGGYLRSIELSKEFGLYRQNFCGCEFSEAESAGRRKEKEGRS